jgi:hypothetical protein
MNKELLSECINEILHKTLRNNHYTLDIIRLKNICHNCECRATKKHLETIKNELITKISNHKNFKITEEISGDLVILWTH